MDAEYVKKSLQMAPHKCVHYKRYACHCVRNYSLTSSGDCVQSLYIRSGFKLASANIALLSMAFLSNHWNSPDARFAFMSFLTTVLGNIPLRVVVLVGRSVVAAVEARLSPVARVVDKVDVLISVSQYGLANISLQARLKRNGTDHIFLPLTVEKTIIKDKIIIT